jgi:hypothetical protein
MICAARRRDGLLAINLSLQQEKIEYTVARIHARTDYCYHLSKVRWGKHRSWSLTITGSLRPMLLS